MAIESTDKDNTGEIKELAERLRGIVVPNGVMEIVLMPSKLQKEGKATLMLSYEDYKRIAESASPLVEYPSEFNDGMRSDGNLTEGEK